MERVATTIKMNPAFLAVFAFAGWGIVPLYWKLLSHIPAQELIVFRVLFSLLFLAPIFLIRSASSQKLDRSSFLALLLSGLCIGSNWLMYVWAVNHDRVVDASLGYFLSPLINASMGALFLGEILNFRQKISLAFACLGILILLVALGGLPLITLFLALTFAFYGFIRKKLHWPTLAGTFYETLFLSGPALCFLIYLFQSGQAQFPHATGREWFILSLCGIITSLPLLAFAEAAKGLSFSSLGIFQFVSPSLQFLLGVLVFHEPFSPLKWMAFGCIWIGLGIFIFDLLRPAKFPVPAE